MNNTEGTKTESAVDAALRSLEVSIERMLGASNDLRGRLESVMRPTAPPGLARPQGDSAKLLEEPAPLVRWIQKLKAQLDLGREATELAIDRLQL